jgi:hypothetical protein
MPARRVPPAPVLATQLGAGRAALAAAILAAPVPSLRLLGTDTATAQRISWLTRVMAVRDGALGVGTARAARRGFVADTTFWLLAGAVCDGLDAVAVTGAIRAGRLRGARPAVLAAGAAGTSAFGVWTALRLRAPRRLRRRG